MFVLLSSLISIAILLVLFYLSHKRERQQEQKYQVISTLREIVQLLRQHRSATHLSLLYKQVHSSEIHHTQTEVLAKCQALIELASGESKPLYRILLSQYQTLFSQWQEQSIAKNQFLHGKMLRHTLFLVDETTVAWLAESERDELIDEYHCHWQVIIENLDALTQLRIAIQDLHQPQGRERFAHCAQRMVRRLNQLTLLSPYHITAPASVEVIRELEMYASLQQEKLNKANAYELTSLISATIFRCYDEMLDEMIESLYLPLPKLALRFT
ncbi:TPA: hypothetical protein RQK05_001710 [Vibrio vulnificus]|nr:hypothetical protein [Vibrio vulnificus]HDY7746888.1 hypothetical protein [Vibrio vulnificus]HDY7756660.1 hypothetical protein [Vibrio vulnificus]HDY7761077.1 hypothetical protein [Vibrio vulnificus]HDY7770200.1 hypothetical protein [Vibrio vulnificus]